MTSLAICTLATDRDQYAAMKASWIAAGFTEDHCRYLLFDNSQGNAHEPYSAINQTLAEASEEYVIFCHQDTLLDQGHGFAQLSKALEELNQREPGWAIVGNAGGTDDLTLVVQVSDPHHYPKRADLPRRVYTLDENFLVIRRESGVACSEGLGGFHLYGTDLCLNALRANRSCWVIDFYLTHLSPGSNISEGFLEGRRQFERHWNPHFQVCLLRPPCSYVALSRYAPFYKLAHARYGRAVLRFVYAVAVRRRR